MTAEFVHNVSGCCWTNSTEAIGARGGQRFSKRLNDFGEDWMGADSNRHRLQTRSDNSRNNVALWQNYCEWSRPKLFGQFQDQLSILRRKVSDPFQAIGSWQMDNKRIDARTTLGFENSCDRDRIKRIRCEAVNGFGRQRHNLALAQQFNRRVAVGRNFRFHFGSFAERTLSDCFLRNSSSFCRSFLSVVARIATARSAAFLAPASPIARVPTGIPPGICTVDNRESRPCSFD